MYICKNCGHVFTEDEIENRYDAWAEEEYGVCPECGDDEYEEAEECTCCGEWVAKDELHEGYCEDCLKKNATFDIVLPYAVENDDEKGFAESILTEEEITNILVNAAREKVKLIGRICDGVEKYALDDKDSFGYFLANRG